MDTNSAILSDGPGPYRELWCRQGPEGSLLASDGSFEHTFGSPARDVNVCVPHKATDNMGTFHDD